MANGKMASAFDTAGGLVGGILNAQKNAIAANHAADMLDEKETGLIRKTVDFALDTVGDVANIATFGATRRIANVFASAETKLDYKGLKQEMAERRSDDDPKNDRVSIKDRANLLLPAEGQEQDDTTEQRDEGPEL